jgi:hypothetical protein
MVTVKLDKVTKSDTGLVVWLKDTYTDKYILVLDQDGAGALAKQLWIFASTGTLPAQEGEGEP